MAGMNVDWKKPWPLGVLLVGLLMLLLAVIGTFTGKLYGKRGTADRAKDPNRLLDNARGAVYLCCFSNLLLVLRIPASIASVRESQVVDPVRDYEVVGCE